jgi:RHS repeat-associated protein
METRRSVAWPPKLRGLTGWSRRSTRAMLVLLALIGAGAIAQVATSTPPPKYRAHDHNSAFFAEFNTLEEAEAAIRSNTAYFGAEGELEHVLSSVVGPGRLWMRYKIKDRPADRHYAAMYSLHSAVAGHGKPGCSTPAADPSYANEGYCGSESQLYAYAVSKYQNQWPGCTVTTAQLSEYSVPSVAKGLISFWVNYTTPNTYRTKVDCPGLSPNYHQWEIGKRVPFYCAAGFENNFGLPVVGEDYGSMNLCKPRRNDISFIEAPIRQCGSCAGEDESIYPATGEKRQREEDFVFSGHAFSRTYRSARQFRNNPSFAVGWNHTWSDRVMSVVSEAPYAYVDEQGNYEEFPLLSGTRYRGANSVDRIMERVNANGIGWRLRLPGGEVREFNLSGNLISVRDPQSPLNDLSIQYSDGVISTVTDAQGRSLQFEYSGNLLRRIRLPEGTSVGYDYDSRRNLTGVTYPGSIGRQYHYNEQGLAGSSIQHNQLTGITAEDGRRLASFSYDARGRVAASRSLGSPNELTSISYPSEDSAAVTTASGGNRNYSFQPGLYRRVLAVQEGGDSEGQTYDSQGRLESQTDKRGYRTEFGYTDAFRTRVVSAVGTDEERRTEFDHNPATGLMTEQRTKDKAGAIVARTVWTYNSRNQIVSTVVHDQVTGTSRQTAVTYCEAADVAAGVCPAIGLATSIDGPRPGTADVVRFEYRMTDDVTCASQPETCPYRKGDLWRTINALGHIEENLRYDGAGRPLSVRDSTGVVTDLEYDPRGRVVASKIRGSIDGSEADDRITRVEYNPTGTVHRVLMPDGSFTRFEYDPAQRLTAVQDAAGNRVVYTLNSAGDRVGEELRDPSGTLRLGMTRLYDTLGRLERQVDANQHATVFRYDADDNLALVTDPLARKTGHEYDPLGRLRSTLQDSDGVAALTQYRYDALDRVTQVLDPNGKSTTYLYNGFGDLTTQQSPDTGQTVFTYDPAGNLQSKTDARGTTATYGHDLLNRLTSVSYPDSGRNVTYSYDLASTECYWGEKFAKGRLTRVVDASGATDYCYDRYGNVSRKLQMTQGRTYVLRYHHTDPQGRLPGQDYVVINPPPGNQMIGMTYPDGSAMRIVRDAQMRPKELRVTLANGTSQVLLHSGSYAPFGPVTGWTFGNGRQMIRSFDLNYQPESIRDAGVGGIDIGYRFDAAGNLESLHGANLAQPARRRYLYDGMDRLKQSRDGTTGNVLHAYDYDATGNRTSRTVGTAAQGYTYATGKHWLASVGGIARQYDAAGNTTLIGASSQGAPPGGCADCMEEQPGPGHPGPGDPPPGETEGAGWTSNSAAATPAVVREFVYDDANRMRAVKHDGAVVMNYLYNGLDERVYRYGSGVAITTLYDEDGKWVGDYDVNGQPIQQVVWLDELPVGLLVGAGAHQKLYYIEADALGTPRVVIDPTRNVAVWRWEAADEPFGDSAPNEDADGDGSTLVFDMRFPGQRYDSSAGLNYNYFRDYDPTTGRYVESDPIGLSGGNSTYGYAAASPLMYDDPDGLIAGLVLRYGARYVLPRLGIHLGANAAVRIAQRQAYRAAKAAKAAAQAVRKKAAGSGPCNPVSKGESGRFSELASRGVKGDKLTPHHMPQTAAQFTSRAEGGALMMPEAQHILTRTYGYRGALTMRSEAGMGFRDVLARDIRDIRRIAPGEYNQGLRNLIQYYRTNFPGLISKP